MVDDVDLVEEHESVQNTECWVIENSGEDDIFQIEKSIGLVDLVPDILVFDFYDLTEFSRFEKELSVRGFESREFGII